MNSLAKVLIVGATNVGKSRLFNRLIQDRHSLVLDREGLTRDLIRRECWLSEESLNPVLLIDSGGYSDKLEDSLFQSELNSLLIEEIKSANVIIFLLSKLEGVRLIERKLSKLVHKHSSCPVILGVNKSDLKRGAEHLEFELQKLGFEGWIMLSAEHNLNIELLKKRIESLLPEDYQKKSLYCEKIEKNRLRLAIIGKVNVGKSSLVNALLNSDSIIVSQIEGTTIDLIEYELKYKSKTYLLIDSPGWKKLKKEGLKIEELDFLSFTRAQKAIKIANILLFVLELSCFLSSGAPESHSLNYLDERVAKEVFESNLPVVIVVNKSDLLNYPDEREQRKYEALIREKFYFLSWAPIVFVSSKYSQKLDRIFKALELINRESGREFTPFELESFLSRANLFLLNASKKITLENIKQLKSSIPTFLIKCSNPDNLNTQQLRLIESQFRSSLQCTYSPIKLYYKKV